MSFDKGPEIILGYKLVKVCNSWSSRGEFLGGESRMRIWDLPVSILCNNHLVGEHGELHIIWTVLSNGYKGYSHHPETMRWQGKMGALLKRHSDQAEEIIRRGYYHGSSLILAEVDCSEQVLLVDPIETQIKLLKNKPCKCKEKL